MKNRMLGLISNKYLRYDYKLIEEFGYFVYFINDEEYTKIGIAGSISSRIKQLQTGNPRKLKVLFLIDGETQNKSYWIERKLHKSFSEKRVNGEWFRISERDIVSVCNKEGYKLYKPITKHNFTIDGVVNV